MRYCVVLWGHCMVLLVTAGYFWVLGGTGWYWSALKCTGGLLGVLSGYCMALLVTAGYFWILGGTGVH